MDIRLTAEDGYTAQRSYSIASATGLEITVQRLDDGEVSPFLTDTYDIGQPVELRGPIGGWFVWRHTDPAPVQLIAGGSGIVPLMAMIRARAEHGSRTPFRLLYSVRTPRTSSTPRNCGGGPATTAASTSNTCTPGSAGPGRRRRPQHPRLARRLPARVFVCGPTGFVETVADIMVALGHDARGIRTERYG